MCLQRAVPRDLLPLPGGDWSRCYSQQSVSRVVARRRAALAADGQRVNDCVDALNYFYGDSRGFQGVRPSAAQLTALAHIEHSVFSDSPPSGWTESSKESLSAILGARASLYPEDGDDAMRVAPLSPDSVIAWPASAGSAELLACLPETQADLMRGGHAAFARPAEEVEAEIRASGRAGIYWDPRLKNDKEAYADFIKELHSRCMIDLQANSPLHQVGIFVVYKKDGTLRIIVDARRVNQATREPPSTRLGSIAALSELQVGQDETLCFSCQDIAHCFYQLRLPEELRQLFGLRPLSAHDAGVTHTSAGIPVEPSTKLWPVLRVLPMGFSWSVFLCQAAHRNLLEKSKLESGLTCEIVDRRPAPSLSHGNVARLIYIDNELFI